MGRAGAADGDRLRRLRHLDHARHHSRRPHRLRAVSTIFPHFVVASAADLAIVERRHVVFTAASPAASSPSVAFALKRRHPDASSLATSSAAVCPDRNVCLAAVANFVNGELWGRRTRRAVGDDLFPIGGRDPRHPSQLYERDAGRRRPLHSCLASWCALARAEAARVVTGSFALGYGVARVICELFREPTSSSASSGRADQAAFCLCIPLDARGIASHPHVRTDV